ncbi:metal-dependent hydrolase [Arthrobacter echini]|uniref:Metal-dependent hydrolase n=1 Tax=Arthrobacter echini TaxID=1529066 RepID=A0A4S5E5A4_9MICC|nr:metal-dependent hydrolase [Arthrobacter echini]THJ66668.1 metal-dependent hydrolase [Arthrobacter echini]
MMGAHHAACGAAAWVAVTTDIEVGLGALAGRIPVLPESVGVGLGLLDVSLVGVVTGALVTAGAALLPDADHHNATIAHSLPPLSNALCDGIGAISGGHRHGTHSIIGIAAFIAIAWVAGLWTVQTETFGRIYPGAGLLAVLLVSFAAKALKIIPDRMRKSPWVVGLAAGIFITAFAPEEQFWFPIAVGIGVIVHIIGDLMTTGGCNLFYPLVIRPPKVIAALPVVNWVWKRNGYVGVPVLGNAGSAREWCLLVPISLYAIGGVGWAVISMGRTGLQTLTAATGHG